MSHFTKLDRANITSAAAFEAAAKELGFTEIRKDVEIKDYVGKKVKVDVSARAPGAKYDVAIKKNAAGKFDMISDWWGIRTERRLYPAMERIGALTNDEAVQNALLRTTTQHTIVSNYRRLGFMARVKVNQDQSINISLSR